MKKNVRLISFIGIMSAFSFVLYSFEISVGFILPQAAFLKIDFSDIPVFLTTLSIGPAGGVAVAFIKNLFHIAITKEPALSGEIANFCAAVAYLIPLAIYRNKKKGLPVYLVFSTICLIITMSVINYFVTLPLYGIQGDLRLPMIFSTFLPFNLIRGAILSVIVLLVYPKLKNSLQKYQDKK